MRSLTALLVLLAIGCASGRREAPDSIEGGYYLPDDLNYQDGRRRVWMFSRGFISEEVLDPDQLRYVVRTIGTYAPSGDRFIGMAEGRRYAFWRTRRGAQLSISVLGETNQEGNAIELRRRGR